VNRPDACARDDGAAGRGGEAVSRGDGAASSRGRGAAPRVRRTWRRVDGVLLLDKPVGPSSNDALQRARRAYSAAKGGHGGTLDPMASGLLPIAFGEATKFLHDLLDADKTYEATMRLGMTTDSGDAEGEVVAERVVEVGDAAIAAACAAFEGEIAQVPPMHSALKRDGRPLYEYARAGVVLEREARPVVVHRIELLGVDRTDPARPCAAFRATVSKGTYVRTLAQDIGERLGCGAHLVALRRTRVGTLDVADAVALDAVEVAGDASREAWLRPLDTLVSALPAIGLADALADRFMQGQRIVLDIASRAPLQRAPPGPVRVYRGARLLGIAEFAPPGLLAPQRVLAPASGE
jgi:tRNA pseudouridine55 synthase